MRDDRVQKVERSRDLRKQSTMQESALWNHLKNYQIHNVKFRRQHPIGPYILDFYCAKFKLAIELDGHTHFTESGIAHDTIRNAYLKAQGINTVRYTNSEISTNLDGVISNLSMIIENYLLS